MASSSNDSLSAAASVSGSLASFLVLPISRNRAEVSSQNLIYGKFPGMQEDFCDFLSEVSGGTVGSGNGVNDPALRIFSRRAGFLTIYFAAISMHSSSTSIAMSA
jgi:hypothetical protein